MQIKQVKASALVI